MAMLCNRAEFKGGEISLFIGNIAHLKLLPGEHPDEGG